VAAAFRERRPQDRPAVARATALAVDERDPRRTSALALRFREIDRRIADIEKIVTGSDFKLRREFRDLER